MTRKAIIEAGLNQVTYEDLTAEEQAEHDAYVQRVADAKTAEENANAEKETLKASAKAKLIAGEALTEAEADTIVL